MAWLITKWFLFLVLSFGFGALAGWGWRRERRVGAVEAPPPETAYDGPGTDPSLAWLDAQEGEAVPPGPPAEQDNDARLMQELAARDSEWNAKFLELERALTRREVEFMGERQKWSLDAAQASESVRNAEAERTAALARSADQARRITALDLRLQEYIAENDRLRTLTIPAPATEEPVRDDRDLWRLFQAEKRARFLELRMAAMEAGPARALAPVLPAAAAQPSLAPDPAPQPAPAPAPAPGLAPELAPELVLAWRERYFSARLRRLEAHRAEEASRESALQAEIERLSAALAASGGEPSEAVGLFAHAAEEAEEQARRVEPVEESGALAIGAEAIAAAERLKWRNKYLESRIGLLERDLRRAEPEAPAIAAPPPEWERERDRLRWRNLFLQGRLSQMLTVRPPMAAMNPLAPPVEPPISEPPISEPMPESEPVPEPESPPEPVEQRPPALNAPREDASDDLQRIVGVGPVNEAKLHALGIYHFDQIAAWTPANVAWVESHLHFPGRIGREEWIVQARRFSSAQGD